MTTKLILTKNVFKEILKHKRVLNNKNIYFMFLKAICLILINFIKIIKFEDYLRVPFIFAYFLFGQQILLPLSPKINNLKITEKSTKINLKKSVIVLLYD